MQISITQATQNDLSTITAFIRKVYDIAIAPVYSSEGNAEFYKYIDLSAVSDRFEQDHWILKALDEHQKLVGIIEIRKNEHVAMFFVDSRMQRQGVGRQLLTAAIQKIQALNPHQLTISVHSSPNSVSAYEKLGFKAVSDEKTVNGIRFTTMEKKLD